MSQPRVSNMSQVWEQRAVLSWDGANSNDFTNKVIIVILKVFKSGCKQVLAIYCHCMVKKGWSKNMQFMIAVVEFCQEQNFQFIREIQQPVEFLETSQQLPISS